MGKLTVAKTLKLSEDDLELFRRAGEVLYGKGHPVPESTVIRELARRGARQVIVKKKAKPKA